MARELTCHRSGICSARSCSQALPAVLLCVLLPGLSKQQLQPLEHAGLPTVQQGEYASPIESRVLRMRHKRQNITQNTQKHKGLS